MNASVVEESLEWRAGRCGDDPKGKACSSMWQCDLEEKRIKGSG